MNRNCAQNLKFCSLAAIIVLIDSFCHIITKQYLDEIQRSCPAIELVGPDAAGRVYMIDKTSPQRKDVGFVKVGSGFDNLDKRIKDMEHFEIDVQVLSVAGPGIDSELLHASPEATVKIAKASNDAISSVVQKYPEKFVGVAEIPLLSIEDALSELHRSIENKGMRGVQLYTTIGGKPLDSFEFQPFFQEAAKMKIPILIHPTYPRTIERRSYESDYEMQMLYTWPYETTLAISRLVFSGMLEKYPNLAFITHHAGAMIPFFAERIRSVYSQARKGGLREQAKISNDPLSYFKMMFHDTSVGGNVAALNCAGDIFGNDRLIYSTDYPFGPEEGLHHLKVTRESVEKMNASPEEREMIYSGNALKLFRL